MSWDREKKKYKWYSPWCDLIIGYLEKAKMSNTVLAEKSGITAFSISAILSGKYPPNPDFVEAFADVLKLSGKERDAFILEGHLAHGTPEIRQYITKLRERVATLNELVDRRGDGRKGSRSD